ncbi:amidohydrolase family protein [Labrys monachus]|uniref:TIM-barrel fold metal-dependent hydrolase n=1 Tax=Labrys monachus TaxID=217067 RepID=A0ABU0F7P9_9HYPH|nr:amidohydrolase family protein [Labrys monachus]MDQ0390642.1 putative TIM-barrel fold metal-dependent hydrolase [Labrys monachus]
MPRPYAGPIIDAHHHLWDLRLGRHPWLAPDKAERGGLGSLDAIRRDYLPADYRRDIRGEPVVASVHVEAGWQAGDCLGETAWLDGLDKAGGVAARYVAHVPLASPEAETLIDRQAQHPRVVGIRDIVSWHPDPARSFAARGDMMDDPAWRRGLARLGHHGLCFDLLVQPHQLGDAARLAADFPDQLFVLDHCGSPIDRDEEGMALWRRGLAALARQPNTVIKISDLVAYDHGWTLQSLGAVIDACLEGFGAARAMFASDFPVACLHARPGDIFTSFKVLTAALSPDEQAALFLETARRVYRIGDASPAALPPR